MDRPIADAPHPLDAEPHDPIVLRRFTYPLSAYPGLVALYAVIADAGGTRLRWEGVRSVTRIPPEYSSPLPR